MIMCSPAHLINSCSSVPWVNSCFNPYTETTPFRRIFGKHHRFARQQKAFWIPPCIESHVRPRLFRVRRRMTPHHPIHRITAISSRCAAPSLSPRNAGEFFEQAVSKDEAEEHPTPSCCLCLYPQVFILCCVARLCETANLCRYTVD